MFFVRRSLAILIKNLPITVNPDYFERYFNRIIKFLTKYNSKTTRTRTRSTSNEEIINYI
jgi:hypothetical protein